MASPEVPVLLSLTIISGIVLSLPYSLLDPLTPSLMLTSMKGSWKLVCCY